MPTFPETLPPVQARIEAALRRAGRPLDSATLVAVTKTYPPETVLAAIAAGLTQIGENKVQEARAKQAETGQRGEWHLIGHLQSNKVKYVPAIFDWVHSIDSYDLAAELDARAREEGKKLKVLLQVNPSGELTKFGVTPELAAPLAEKVNALPSLELRGLMMLAPYYEEVERTRPHFAALRETRDRLERETGLILPELSMGMSSDFEVALEEGSTILRLGTILFGTRPKASKVARRGDEEGEST
jgi:pyridoxal phosphate enzyme (YggS family)